MENFVHIRVTVYIGAPNIFECRLLLTPVVRILISSLNLYPFKLFFFFIKKKTHQKTKLRPVMNKISVGIYRIWF